MNIPNGIRNGKMSANGYRTQQTDSLYLDSIQQVDSRHLLNTVEDSSETKEEYHYGDSYLPSKVWMRTMNIRQSVDQLRDEGKEIYTLPELFEKLTPFFRWNKQGRHIQL
ncbi:hypothetical protein [Bacteroides thetaiotaomicron]|uniref:hypothetical protein n=1 Tax=Bacteroides thetaiotaomicron TaxID=818 RepID=UPI0021657C6E|nr:hypothetical protein [Bacteroides thetaiotaomicron]MCS2487298.1 hypothetical protein [Bacteroides thetaiotaomicron]